MMALSTVEITYQSTQAVAAVVRRVVSKSSQQITAKNPRAMNIPDPGHTS